MDLLIGVNPVSASWYNEIYQGLKVSFLSCLISLGVVISQVGILLRVEFLINIDNTAGVMRHLRAL